MGGAFDVRKWVMFTSGIRIRMIAVLVWSSLVMACSASAASETDDTPLLPHTTTTISSAEHSDISGVAVEEGHEAVREVSGHVRSKGVLKENAPAFELKLLTEETLRLTDLEGKVVVLNFWASWCLLCRFEMPDFEIAWNEFRDRGVVFVGVAVSDFEEDVRSFARKTGITYHIGIDGGSEMAAAYGIKTLPTTVFVDRQGQLARKRVNRAYL